MPKRASTTTSPPPAMSGHPSEPATFNDDQPLPKLFVFDLDYTLWPFWIDTHCTPPFKPLSGAKAGTAAKDRYGGEYGFYHGVPAVLTACYNKGIKVAAASRTHTPDLAHDLLGMLSVDTGGEQKTAKSMFANLQIYPGSKITHMKKLNAATKIGYEDMLFFDDEARNKDTERELGVCFVLVRDGVDAGVIDEGVRAWRKRRGLGGVAEKGKSTGKVVEVVGGTANA